VSGQLLTAVCSLGANQEKVGGLLLIAPGLGSPVGEKQAFVKALHDLQFLPRLSIFNELPLVLFTQAFDDLCRRVYTPQAHDGTCRLKMKFGCGHAFFHDLGQRPSLLEPALRQSRELLLRVNQVMG
jgi:hypothetical protein